MTAQMLSNVQNIIAIGLTDLGSEQYEISIELNACGKIVSVVGARLNSSALYIK